MSPHSCLTSTEASGLSEVERLSKRSRNSLAETTSSPQSVSGHLGLFANFSHLNTQCFYTLGLLCPSIASLTAALDSQIVVDVQINEVSKGPFLPDLTSIEPEINAVFERVFKFWPILDRELFDQAFESLRMTRPYGHNKIEWDHIALVHSVLALGTFVYNSMSSGDPKASKNSLPQGEIWFRQAVTLAPPSQCSKNYITLNASMCMTLYLFLSGAITQCSEFLDHVCAAVSKFIPGNTNSLTQSTNDRTFTLQRRTYLSCQLIDANLALLTGQARRLPVLPQFFPNAAQDEQPSPYRAIETEVSAINLVHKLSDSSVLATSGSMLMPDLNTSLVHRRAMKAEIQTWFLDNARNVLKQAGTLPEKTVMAQYAAGDENLSTADLLFLLTYARIRMLVYYPYLWHIFTPASTADISAATFASECVEAAAYVVDCTLLLATHDKLAACTIQTLALACTALLVSQTRHVASPSSPRAPAPIYTVPRWYAGYQLLTTVASAHPGTQEYLHAITPVYHTLSEWTVSPGASEKLHGSSFKRESPRSTT